MIKKITRLTAFACVAIGIALWLPNFIYNFGYGYSLWTFVINPIGALLGYVGKSKTDIILNIIMTFSFFILMAVGYSIQGLLN
ncbi:hypothetical protein [Halalkalibacillus halophilus]|uniref:hypothetical protein n=1 Tax=Halalkalibacillus halophilus TaxID=392827 RepID=UPI0004808CAD|nr:hypothetical protein [Halalkalibacillus halophilus]